MVCDRFLQLCQETWSESYNKYISDECQQATTYFQLQESITMSECYFSFIKFKKLCHEHSPNAGYIIMQHYNVIMYIQNDVALISIKLLKACPRVLCASVGNQ